MSHRKKTLTHTRTQKANSTYKPTMSLLTTAAALTVLKRPHHKAAHGPLLMFYIRLPQQTMCGLVP